MRGAVVMVSGQVPSLSRPQADSATSRASVSDYFKFKQLQISMATIVTVLHVSFAPFTMSVLLRWLPALSTLNISSIHLSISKGR